MFKDRSLSEKFEVRAAPTLVFVDAEGDKIGEIIGFAPPDVFLEKAGMIVNKK